ncbi:hypothetical protein J0H58_37555 [bacterium]|nr:hypothetical protein [bacterium]
MTRISTRLGAATLSALAALSLAGCGSDLQPVTGKVVYEDGTPVKGGDITFNSKGRTPAVNASGNIADDGTFTLKFNGREGAAPGSYKVVVVGKEGYGEGPAVDGVYGDPLNTPLTQEIVAGKNDLTITVKRPTRKR